MALGGVYMADTDGNIGVEKTSLTEKISGLLFDISGQPDFWTTGPAAIAAAKLKDTVVEINQLEDLVELGIAAYTGELDEKNISKDFLSGIPYYHIKHYFQLNGGNGRLFIAFADCSKGWSALSDMQQVSGGIINQFGVWTEQPLWKIIDDEAPKYGVNMVADLQMTMNAMANNSHAPAVVVLNANTSKVQNGDSQEAQVVFSKIPEVKKLESRYVSIAISQGIDSEVRAMQTSLASTTPVGNVGAVLGVLSTSNVAESIGYVMQHNLRNLFADVEMGFGDSTVKDGKLANSLRYSALTDKQIDTLHDAGYIFLCKYAGLEGNVYFNADTSCSEGDYRTIARNRVINKSRRNVRQVLLPYTNAPLKVDQNTGQLSAAQITIFKNAVEAALKVMADTEEISGIGTVQIPAGQNILKNDTLKLKYALIPMGTAQRIEVTEGFAVSSQK